MLFKVIVVCLGLILASLFRQRTDPDIFLHVKLNFSYDYIIVGAGSAGLVIANRLSEDKDVTALLVEAGGSELEHDYIPIPLAAPLLQQTDVDWSFYTAPQQTAFKAMKEQIAQTEPFQEMGATLNRLDHEGVCDKEEFDTDAYWECLIRHYAVTAYHPTCTCRIGSINDKNAVVDTKLRVKGIQNLRIADASVMRHVTSGNTNAPTIMIGEKAADLIRGKDTVVKFRKQIKQLRL